MPYYIVLVRGNKNGATNWFEYEDEDELLDELEFLKESYFLKHVIINGRLSTIDTWKILFKKSKRLSII